MDCYSMGAAAQARLDGYFSRIAEHLKDRRKRESFAMYAIGILGDGERKSAEPIAARACSDPGETKRTHDKLLHFLARSVWDDRAVRLEAARYAIDALGEREPIVAWIVDDTGFLKQGTESVGVQRQYTGSAGKITNCQIGVSLAIATRTEHVPIDFELYLPESWTENRAKCNKARVPDDVCFQTKIDLALGMIGRASQAHIPGEILLADASYGSSARFRNAVRRLGFDFAVNVQSNADVVRLDSRDRAIGEPCSVAELVDRRGPRGFQRFTWREASKAPLRSYFRFERVKTTGGDDDVPFADREPLWLVTEWPEGETKPTKYTLTTLRRRMSKKLIIRTLKERWRVERTYQDLKGELGLDHFEGRSFPGWHHHVSVVLCCYAFVVAERVRAFPPEARRSRSRRPLQAAA